MFGIKSDIVLQESWQLSNFLLFSFKDSIDGWWLTNAGTLYKVKELIDKDMTKLMHRLFKSIEVFAFLQFLCVICSTFLLIPNSDTFLLIPNSDKTGEAATWICLCMFTEELFFRRFQELRGTLCLLKMLFTKNQLLRCFHFPHILPKKMRTKQSWNL